MSTINLNAEIEGYGLTPMREAFVTDALAECYGHPVLVIDDAVYAPSDKIQCHGALASTIFAGEYVKRHYAGGIMPDLAMAFCAELDALGVG